MRCHGRLAPHPVAAIFYLADQHGNIFGRIAVERGNIHVGRSYRFDKTVVTGFAVAARNEAQAQWYSSDLLFSDDFVGIGDEG